MRSNVLGKSKISETNRNSNEVTGFVLHHPCRHEFSILGREVGSRKKKRSVKRSRKRSTQRRQENTTNSRVDLKYLRVRKTLKPSVKVKSLARPFRGVGDTEEVRKIFENVMVKSNQENTLLSDLHSDLIVSIFSFIDDDGFVFLTIPRTCKYFYNIVVNNELLLRTFFPGRDPFEPHPMFDQRFIRKKVGFPDCALFRLEIKEEWQRQGFPRYVMAISQKRRYLKKTNAPKIFFECFVIIRQQHNLRFRKMEAKVDMLVECVSDCCCSTTSSNMIDRKVLKELKQVCVIPRCIVEKSKYFKSIVRIRRKKKRKKKNKKGNNNNNNNNNNWKLQVICPHCVIQSVIYRNKSGVLVRNNKKQEFFRCVVCKAMVIAGAKGLINKKLLKNNEKLIAINGSNVLNSMTFTTLQRRLRIHKAIEEDIRI